MKYMIRQANPTDLHQIFPLLNRLVEFPLPIKREKIDLLRDDIDLVKKWSKGQLPNTIANIAINDEDIVCGFIFVVIQNDTLSKSISAQVEVLVSCCDGEGIGQMLLLDIENQVKEMGINLITLDVYANNLRAIHVYEKLNYIGELVRCVKHL